MTTDSKLQAIDREIDAREEIARAARSAYEFDPNDPSTWARVAVAVMGVLKRRGLVGSSLTATEAVRIEARDHARDVTIRPCRIIVRPEDVGGLFLKNDGSVWRCIGYTASPTAILERLDGDDAGARENHVVDCPNVQVFTKLVTRE